MITNYIAAILRGGNPGDTVIVRGWIRSKREAKEFAFVDVNDGSCLANIQVVINSDVTNYATILKQINTGASIEIEGELVASPAKGQRIEVKATQVLVCGEADPETYPLQKKRHSFEFLRDIGHLRSKTNTLSAVFRVRNACATAIHQFFKSVVSCGYIRRLLVLVTAKVRVKCFASLP
jgi:asparaginyl-tRNA synthetase